MELLAEVYQQAKLAGIQSGLEVEKPSDLFERLRTRIYRAKRGFQGMFGLGTRAQQVAVEQLHYLMACLEETNRVAGMAARLDEASQRGYTMRELEERLYSLIGKPSALSSRPEDGTEGSQIVAVAFA